MSRNGGVIGIQFDYIPLRDPRTQPVATEELLFPLLETSITASDEFYAKFHSMVLNESIARSVYANWAAIENQSFEDYKNFNLGDVEDSRFLRAAMTGYLMAVCEESAFKTFRKGFMATYLIGAMLIYINTVERETSLSSQKVLMTGLLSGYHKAHMLYQES